MKIRHIGYFYRHLNYFQQVPYLFVNSYDSRCQYIEQEKTAFFHPSGVRISWHIFCSNKIIK